MLQQNAAEPSQRQMLKQITDEVKSWNR